MSSVDTPSQQTLHEFYLDHHGWLKGWLRRRLGCNADAADLAHDTFIRLLLAPPVAIETPRAYLATVAGRLLANLHRRRSLEQAYLEALASLPPSLVSSLETQALVLETLHAVDRVLDRLSERARRAFVMAQLEGHTQEEIAQQLNISARSVQRHLARAYEECIVLATELP